MTITSTRRIAALSLAALFAVGACSGAATPAPATPAPATPAAATPAPATPAPATPAAATPAAATPAAGTPAAGGVTGSIVVSGSSTVEPISTAVAEAFTAANPGFKASIEGPGTGDGFKKFCKGETDISDASRKIKDEEKATCAAAGIEFIELKIAYDGMTVMTSPKNDAVKCLSFPDLYALIGPESTGFDTWDKAAPLAKELGSNTVFPAAPLQITGPGEESGTFDSFVEIALDALANPRGKIDPATKHTTTRPDYTASANDNAIIEGISGSDSSLGWVGFAFAEENTDKVKILEVSKAANGTCVAPSATTIADGSYPLSRSLYIYINKAKEKANPAVAAYVDFYLTEGTISKVLETVPYVNLPAAELGKSRDLWAASK